MKLAERWNSAIALVFSIGAGSLDPANKLLTEHFG